MTSSKDAIEPDGRGESDVPKDRTSISNVSTVLDESTNLLLVFDANALEIHYNRSGNITELHLSQPLSEQLVRRLERTDHESATPLLQSEDGIVLRDVVPTELDAQRYLLTDADLGSAGRYTIRPRKYPGEVVKTMDRGAIAEEAVPVENLTTRQRDMFFQVLGARSTLGFKMESFDGFPDFVEFDGQTYACWAGEPDAGDGGAAWVSDRTS